MGLDIATIGFYPATEGFVIAHCPRNQHRSKEYVHIKLYKRLGTNKYRKLASYLGKLMGITP
jgi:hypothetical protein